MADNKITFTSGPRSEGDYLGLAPIFRMRAKDLPAMEQIRETARFLTGIFLLLFIPGTVGIIEHLDLLGSIWLPGLMAVVPLTFLVFAASGKVTDLMIGRKRK